MASGGQDTDIVIIDVVSEAGKCRLTGHSGSITDTCFYETGIEEKNIVISSSKDKLIKFWNLATQCCFRTIVDYTTEIWGITLLRGGDFLAAGSTDTNISVYRLKEADESGQSESTHSGAVIGDMTDEQIHCPLSVQLVGSIRRAGGRGRICNLISDETGRVLAFHGKKDKMIELFIFHTSEEAEKRMKKRLKKNTDTDADVGNVSLSDEVRRLPPIAVGNNIKSIDALIGGESNLRVVCTFENNQVKVFAMNLADKHPEPELLKTLQSQGHSTEVRTLSFSSDALSIASADANSIKLWNRESLRSIQTISDTGYALCSCFAPGDRHVLIGRMDGKLLIADVLSGEVIEEIPAHQKELWTMALTHNKTGIVTGGGDATVKLWTFELIDVEDAESNAPTRKVLSLMHRNTLKLEETVQCVGLSPNGKFLAVGLLDSTVKMFFVDSLKFYLALYGHKLSVLTLDISDDSSLIVTGSADRNVKIWGMDFGDCHRSLFAHDDSVMAVKFIPKTHIFWSCGKDGSVKQWDGDSFEQIQSVPGHLGLAYFLTVSPSGHFFASCGSDRTIRLFERSQEPIVLEDLRETEREEREREQLATSGEEVTVAGAVAPLNLPSRRTVGAEQAVELLMDALNILEERRNAQKGDPIPLLMRAYNAETPVDLIVFILWQIKPSDLEEALLLLPFTSVCELLKVLPTIVVKRTDQTEILCKVISFLLRIHRRPIVGNQSLLPAMKDLVGDLERTVNEQRDIVGKNLYSLKIIQYDVEQKELASGAELFYDAIKSKKQKDRKMQKRQLKKKISLQMVT